MKLLFINSLKGLKKKKVQMLGIIILVLLSTTIFTAMSLALDRFEDRYYSYLKEQNVEDLSVTPSIDYKTEYTYYDVLKIMNMYSFNDNEKALLMGYATCLREDVEICSPEILNNVSYVFDKYKISEVKKERILNLLSLKYNFNHEKTYSKLSQDDKIIYRVMPYNKDKKINKAYLIDGEFPTNDNEITILPGFAETNKIKINDMYKVGESEYKVVGFAYASDYMYPLISISSPIFTESKNNIVFLTQAAYDKFGGIEEVVNSIKYREKITDRDELMKKVEIFSKEKNVKVSMFDLLRMTRTKTPKMEFDNDRLFAQYFLYLLLSISVVIILIISKKRIDEERGQIGVLKALGYKTSNIATSYLTYPIIGGLVGGTIGYFIGLIIHPFIAKLFVSYYNLPLSTFSFNLKYLLLCTVLPIAILSILTYLISLFMLRHKSLYLLKEGSNLKVNWFNKLVSKITSKLPFKSRFRYSLAARSLGKLSIVTITSFSTGLLIVLTLIGMNLFSSMIDKSYKGLKYDYVISYSTNQVDENKNDDLILEKPLTVEKLYDQNNNKKELKKRNKDNENDIIFTANGIDKNIKKLDIYDSKNNKIISKLNNKNDIIINSNISELNGININDKIKFKESNELFNVVGINDSFFGKVIYIDRKNLSDVFKSPLSYNKKFSNDGKYSSYSKIPTEEIKNITNIFSLKDLKENIVLGMQTSNYSIYIIITFASIMALIIIAVIANIIVEENKKTISLMKVIGYNNKTISSIVLNIYTPFVIFAYLISIPTMIFILKKIVEVLTKDIDYSIPIGISFEKVMIGLIGLLIAYYIAIRLSKKALNKVPLAVALKRE